MSNKHTPGKGNAFTDDEKEQFRYDEYCQCKLEIGEEPLAKDQWREFDEYGEKTNWHTPGKWIAKYNTDEFPGQACIESEEGSRVIAVMDTSDETDSANIDLVCASPAMYDLLSRIVGSMSLERVERFDLNDEAKSIIDSLK
jgi:hypothetical protein